MIYTLNITPKPTPRPRLGKYGAYNTSEYTKYKNDLIYLIRGCKIPQADYGEITAVFFLPFPKSTAKRNLIDAVSHRCKPDIDNYYKVLGDALEQAGVIKNDSQVYALYVRKQYTIKQPRIEFQLQVAERAIQSIE